jgi:hypothetical protein
MITTNKSFQKVSGHLIYLYNSEDPLHVCEASEARHRLIIIIITIF